LPLLAIALYRLADRLLDRIEVSRGSRFERRTVVFFVILLRSAVVAFPMLRRLPGH
jgi:hypothetical protein